MTMRLLSLFAGVLFLAACQVAPEETAATGGGGQAVQATTQAPAQAPAQAVQPAPVPVPGPRPGSPEDLVVNVGDRVFFDFDKYDLKPRAREVLERQATWLKRFPDVRIIVEGHCDERGTREYNLALGERRANAAKDYLVSLGVDPSRVRTISYGKERPVATGSNEASWRQNRRAVTTLSGPGA